MSKWSGLVAACILGATVASSLWLVRSLGGDDAPFETSPELILVETVEVETLLLAPAVLSLDWGVPEVVRAPGWTGLVTAVFVAGDDDVVSGDIIAEIDGILRIAAATTRPFHRALAAGDSGDDVVSLQRLLVDLGYDSVPVDGTVRSSTLAAIRAWARELGVQGAVTQFDPSWVIWLPLDGFRVDEILLEPGLAAPSQGERILATRPSLNGATVDPVPAHAPEALGRWILEIDGEQFLLEDSGELSQSALPGVAALADLTEEALFGTARLQTTAALVWLPAGSVQINARGDTCVWVVDGAVFQPTPVSILDSNASRVAVSGLGAGLRVLVNAGTVLADPRCR